MDELNTKLTVQNLSTEAYFISGQYDPNATKEASVIKYGNVVYVNIYVKLADTGFDAWTVTPICHSFPKAVIYSRSNIISVDGYPGSNVFFQISPAGDLFVCSRDNASNGKVVMGGFTYIAAE